MSKELEALKRLRDFNNCDIHEPHMEEDLLVIEQALERKEKLEEAIRDLFANHIEFVVEEDRCYFKIKNSKGKEKSFTSKTFEEFWKEVFRI